MYNFFMDDLQLPIAPSELSISVSNKNETVTLMNDGEVNILKKPGLTEVDFEVSLPNIKYPFAVYPEGFKPATFYLSKFEKLKVNQKPFQFIVNRSLPNGKLLFDTNLTVSIEDYEIVEGAEDGFDLTVRIRLKQYRIYGNKKIKPVANSTKLATIQKNRPVSKPPTPKTYKVVSGDTLWAIAKRFLGDGSKFPELAKLNGITNPNKIKAGQVIKIG